MSVTADAAGFAQLFPEFSAAVPARVTLAIDEAVEELDPAAWSAVYPRAVLTYAAHLLCLSESRIASATVSETGAVVVPQSGQIQSATAENLTVTFAASARGKSANEEWLGQTNYGQAFAALRRRTLSRGRLSW